MRFGAGDGAFVMSSFALGEVLNADFDGGGEPGFANTILRGVRGKKEASFACPHLNLGPGGTQQSKSHNEIPRVPLLSWIFF